MNGGHWGGLYTDYNGEGFFLIPSFSFHIAKQGLGGDGPWVFVTFSIAWGNKGVYLTYYRSRKAIKANQ